MAKFRKKPVVIESIQWTGKNHREMFDFLSGQLQYKEYMTAQGAYFYIDHSKVEGGLVIKTLEGEHLASIGDWIIKGVSGEFYPCKPDIFEKTYEPVEDIPESPVCFEKELEQLINKHSKENDSNTPDFILSDYLCRCLATFRGIVEEREKWYGVRVD